MRLPRILVALLGGLAVAWFALGAVQAHDTGRAARIASAAAITPAQARHADALLDTAGTLNPDREVALLRAELLRDRGRPDAAKRALERLTAAEPLNLAAWTALASVAGDDKPVLLRAFDRIAYLVPRFRAG